MITAPNDLRRVLVTIPELARVLRDVVPEATEKRVRGWYERGPLKCAGKVPAVHFRGLEALRALLLVRCQHAFGADSKVATAIAAEVDDGTLQLLADDDSPEPSVTVHVGRFNYKIPLERAPLGDVLRRLEELPR